MKPEVEREWRFNTEPHEEYVIQVITDPGVRNVFVDDAIRAAAQYIHDVATNEGVRVNVRAGRANQELSYVPSLSMNSHEKLYEADNTNVVVARKDDTIYVKE